MRVPQIVITFLLGASIASSFLIRSTRYGNGALSRRDPEPEAEVLHAPLNERFDEGLLSYLEKRRGGGGSSGGGGRGGGSSSGSSSGSSPDAGKSGSSGSSSGSRNTGTASSSSISRPSYGGGRYYGGGATSAYRSGGRSPAGIVPFALAGAALGFFPGLWLYGAYEYPYSHPYSFHNASNSSEPQVQNETLPIKCLCAQYSACGCDDNNDSTFLDSIVGNGSTADENSTLVHVGNVNGTKTIVLNGTLPNGTDTTNSTDNSTNSGSSTTSGALKTSVIENSGFWLMGAIVGATIWMM